jgi:putative DNA primase/helicase
MLYGEGRNGKSLFLNILGALLGDYAGNTSFDTLDPDSRARADLAKLRGTRIVTIIETDEDKRLSEARIKALSGNDRVITAEAKYQDPFDYRVTFKIWMAMNHKPVITGMDYAIWRRIKPIPFTQTFTYANDDRKLEGKLLAELPGILNWALKGLADWRVNGLGTCPTVEGALSQYRGEMNVIGQWISDRYTVGPSRDEDELKRDESCRAGSLYSNYKDWCEVTGKKFINITRWGKTMAQLDYPKITLPDKLTFYTTLRLKPHNEWNA